MKAKGLRLMFVTFWNFLNVKCPCNECPCNECKTPCNQSGNDREIDLRKVNILKLKFLTF